MTGCNNNGDNIEKTKITVSEGKPLVQQKNVYASASIGNGNILFGGENGLSIINTSDSDNNQKLSSTFNIPTFESANELFKRVDGTELYKSNDENATQPEKSRIYSMLRVDDGIIIGGSFASVNGVEKHNIVKLNLDGTINDKFNVNIDGSVYKIVRNQDKLYISGIIGSYNDKEAYSIVQTDLNGKLNENFIPLKDYMWYIC